jgi:DNA-binding transcriptional regulator YbjK
VNRSEAQKDVDEADLISRPRRRRRRPDSRGAVRLRQILDGAVQVIGTGGLASLTHRAVAEAAGVPLGSMTYYFRDRAELVDQTMSYAVRIERQRMTAIVERVAGAPSVDHSVELLTEIFLDKTIADPLYDLALFEMFMEATRNPELRKQTRDWSALIAGIIDRVLPPTDPTLPRAVAIQLVAAEIDGLMLESSSNREMTVQQLSDHLRALIVRIVPG